MQMLKKGSKLNSILTGTCPKCQNENMYVDKNPFNLRKVLKMHENCSHCGLKYQIEPSFFYGAMYVSYGLTVGIGVAIFVISNVIIGFPVKPTFIGIIVGIIALMPVTARLARNIYINMFIAFDKNWKQNS